MALYKSTFSAFICAICSINVIFWPSFKELKLLLLSSALTITVPLRICSNNWPIVKRPSIKPTCIPCEPINVLPSAINCTAEGLVFLKRIISLTKALLTWSTWLCNTSRPFLSNGANAEGTLLNSPATTSSCVIPIILFISDISVCVVTVPIDPVTVTSPVINTLWAAAPIHMAALAIIPDVTEIIFLRLRDSNTKFANCSTPNALPPGLSMSIIIV